MTDIYTDGACKRNPGPGGWAAVLIEEGSERAIHGGEPSTTNNRMEITAVIEGLLAVPEGSNATVFSDSEYVVKTMTRNWKRNVNKDLWARLDAAAAGRRVTWEWVRGHAGHPLNEKADRLAQREAKAFEANPEGERLTHVDEAGKARMVDVGAKPETSRVAVARGVVRMKPETLAMVASNTVEKGDVLGIARTAGIMGAKSTATLIPLCHPLPLDRVAVDFHVDEESSSIEIEATASTTARTGVEMEAMTAVSVAALTIYDMCKAVDRGIRIDAVRLARKSGGKSGDIVLE